MRNDGRLDRNPATLLERRNQLRANCGLDAFAQPAEVWLEMAIAAAARGEHVTASDCERAMELSLERWGG